MTFSEMNARQKKTFLIIVDEFNDIVGGLENAMLDNEEDSAEYKSAERQLKDHEGLKEQIYKDITCNYPQNEKDIRFCGKEWIMERIERRLCKEGY